jgi:hypothetical protein
MSEKQYLVRPLQEEDITLIVKYWTGLSARRLLKMAVNPQMAPTKDYLIERLQKYIKNPPNDSGYLMMVLNGKCVGYVVLKDLAPDGSATVHLHTWDFTMNQKKDRMILFCMAVVQFYERFKVNRMIANTFRDNQLTNILIKKMGFTFIKSFFGAPAAISMQRENNQYFIDREVAANFLNKVNLGNKL